MAKTKAKPEQYRFKEFDIFVSREIQEELEELEKDSPEYKKEYDPKYSRYPIENHGTMWLKAVIENRPVFKSIMRSYSKILGIEKIAILNAHGFDDGRTWNYSFSKGLAPVQTWINDNDGRYSTLVILCCNPEAREIRSNISLVIAPNNVYSGFKEDQGEVQMELFMPIRGYLSSYIIEHEAKRLARKARKAS